MSVKAMVETLATQPMFRDAFCIRHVLVPADAFYAWKAIADGSKPYLIRLRDQSMAELMDCRHSATG